MGAPGMTQPGSWVSGGAGLGGQQGRARMENSGLPVSPLGKEFQSAAVSGDKPRGLDWR